MAKTNYKSQSLQIYRRQDLSGDRQSFWAFHYPRIRGATRLLVISSRTLSSWRSLVEITRELESYALSLEDSELALLENPLLYQPQDFLKMQEVLILHTNDQSLLIMRKLRAQFPHLRFALFLAAEAIAELPQFYDQLSPLPLREDDHLFVLSEGDKHKVSSILSQARVSVVDWPRPERRSKKVVDFFCYAGRVSFSKNIHGLIHLYSEALKINPKIAPLRIIGTPDSFGEQFQKKWISSYQQKLISLIDALSLNDRVSFSPSMPQSQWRDFCREESFVFVSASLNLDENFGLSPRQALDNGAPALLPSWGGFRDLKTQFNDQVVTFPIQRRSPETVCLDVEKAAKIWAEHAFAHNTNKGFSGNFAQQLIDMLSQSPPQKMLSYAHWWLEKQDQLTKTDLPQWYGPYKDSLEDPATLIRHLDGYGAGEIAEASEVMRLFPWIDIKNKSYHSLFDESVLDNPTKQELWQRGWSY